MLLVIPAIEIKEGRTVRTVLGGDGSVYTDDPVETARLYRMENAKSLHVTDVDGAVQGHPVNSDLVHKLVQSVDIPVELGGGLRTFEAVEQAFGMGIYRAVVGTMLIERPDEAKRIIDTFGPSKIVLGIDARNGIVRTHGWVESSGLTAVSVALNAKALGFRRIIYTDTPSDVTRGVNLQMLRTLAEGTGMRITASGGIGGLDDLLKIQELEKYGVDSVVIGRALYENKFSCQDLWRRCETGRYPYTAKI
jgi:phosphoribosylformimino-5-aminoimidazole carboxamide ribotide isomerase